MLEILIIENGSFECFGGEIRQLVLNDANNNLGFKNEMHDLCLPVCLWLFDSLCPSQQFFSYVGTGLPGLNQYYARISCLVCLSVCGLRNKKISF